MQYCCKFFQQYINTFSSLPAQFLQPARTSLQLGQLKLKLQSSVLFLPEHQRVTWQLTTCLPALAATCGTPSVRLCHPFTHELLISCCLSLTDGLIAVASAFQEDCKHGIGQKEQCWIEERLVNNACTVQDYSSSCSSSYTSNGSNIISSNRSNSSSSSSSNNNSKAQCESLDHAAMSAQQSNGAMRCPHMDAAKPDVAQHSITECLVQLLNLLQQLGALCRPHGNQHAGQGVITDHGKQLPPLLAVQTRQQASLSLIGSCKQQ